MTDEAFVALGADISDAEYNGAYEKHFGIKL
jgi:hypothetical protein